MAKKKVYEIPMTRCPRCQAKVPELTTESGYKFFDNQMHDCVVELCNEIDRLKDSLDDLWGKVSNLGA